MPWVPTKHALRKLRESRGWSLQDVVDKTGISIRSLTTLESRTPPSFVRAETADHISAAFDLKLRDFNNWPAHVRWISWVPHRRAAAKDEDIPQLDPVGTLAKLAKNERDLGLHAVTVQTSVGPRDLLGADRLHKMMTMPKLHADRVYAVCGIVDQHATLPSSAARKIKAVEHEGAVFRMTRLVSKNRPHYASVVAPRAEITERLMAAYDSGERLMVDVRVVFAPPEGPWRGFFWIEDGPPVSKKFALVVQNVIVETK